MTHKISTVQKATASNPSHLWRAHSENRPFDFTPSFRTQGETRPGMTSVGVIGNQLTYRQFSQALDFIVTIKLPCIFLSPVGDDSTVDPDVLKDRSKSTVAILPELNYSKHQLKDFPKNAEHATNNSS
jgi:hypothetical protein